MTLLILITGLPCTGKTTIARELSKLHELPVFSKDDFKELMFDHLGYSDREQSKAYGKATYPILYHLTDQMMGAKKPFILESNFSREYDSDPISKLLNKYNYQVIQIDCHCDGEVLFNRFLERSNSGKRHPGHNDQGNADEFKESLLRGKQDILDIEAKVFHINSTNLTEIDLSVVNEYIYQNLKK